MTVPVAFLALCWFVVGATVVWRVSWGPFWPITVTRPVTYRVTKRVTWPPWAMLLFIAVLIVLWPITSIAWALNILNLNVRGYDDNDRNAGQK